MNTQIETATGLLIDGCFLRTARKEHRCRSCLEPIMPGTRYIEYVGEVAAYSSGSRYHQRPGCRDGLIDHDEIARRASAVQA